MSIPWTCIYICSNVFLCLNFKIFQHDHCVASFAFICISWKCQPLLDAEFSQLQIPWETRGKTLPTGCPHLWLYKMNHHNPSWHGSARSRTKTPALLQLEALSEHLLQAAPQKRAAKRSWSSTRFCRHVNSIPFRGHVCIYVQVCSWLHFELIGFEWIWSAQWTPWKLSRWRHRKLPNCCTTTTQRRFSSFLKDSTSKCLLESFGYSQTSCCVLLQQSFWKWLDETSRSMLQSLAASSIHHYSLSFKSLVWLYSNGTCTRCCGAEGVRIQ